MVFTIVTPHTQGQIVVVDDVLLVELVLVEVVVRGDIVVVVEVVQQFASASWRMSI